MAVDRAEFESDLQREGKIEPNMHRASRAHEFDARLFVFESSITLVVSADRCAYRPSATCHVPAGTTHEEQTETDGVRYLAGRRPATKVAAAE